MNRQAQIRDRSDPSELFSLASSAERVAAHFQGIGHDRPRPLHSSFAADLHFGRRRVERTLGPAITRPLAGFPTLCRRFKRRRRSSARILRRAATAGASCPPAAPQGHPHRRPRRRRALQLPDPWVPARRATPGLVRGVQASLQPLSDHGSDPARACCGVARLRNVEGNGAFSLDEAAARSTGEAVGQGSDRGAAVGNASLRTRPPHPRHRRDEAPASS